MRQIAGEVKFMLVVMQESVSEQQILNVTEKLLQLGFDIHRSDGARHIILGTAGGYTVDAPYVKSLEGVEKVLSISSPYKLVSRAFKSEPTQIRIKDVTIGGPEVVIMAGPSAVESREQMIAIAQSVWRGGAKVLVGGAFKPRTSPYSFQGLGEEGLKYLRQAADQFEMLLMSEVIDTSQIPLLLRYVDIVQIGARNMQNFCLLKAVGQIKKPVLLKRGPVATIEETLLAAEYIMAGGNYEVILCERGVRTFETHLKYTFDISAIPIFKTLSHLPVAADPGRATGQRDKVPAIAQAALAAGADALLIDVHHDPENALCDGAQALLPDQFEQLMARLRLITTAVDRTMFLMGS